LRILDHLWFVVARPRASDRPADIEAGVAAMADDVWAWCESAQMFGMTVTVKIKYADFQQARRSRSLSSPVLAREILRAVSLDLVRSVYPPAKGIRLLGVTVPGFEMDGAATPEQLGLALEIGALD
jgi:DNA polymerase-4